MKYTKNQKKQIQGFERFSDYKKFIVKKYKLEKIQFKIIDDFIVIKSQL